MRACFCSEMILLSNNHYLFVDETGFDIYILILCERDGLQLITLLTEEEVYLSVLLCVIDTRDVIIHEIIITFQISYLIL